MLGGAQLPTQGLAMAGPEVCSSLCFLSGPFTSSQLKSFFFLINKIICYRFLTLNTSLCGLFMSLSVLVTHPFQFTIKLNSLKQQIFIISQFLMVRNLGAGLSWQSSG